MGNTAGWGAGQYDHQSRNATTAPPGFRGSAPGPRFPRAGGRHSVEVLTAYLNPGDDLTTLRECLSAFVAAPRQRQP